MLPPVEGREKGAATAGTDEGAAAAGGGQGVVRERSAVI